MSVWSLLPAAAGFLTTALTKPQKQQYSSKYMDYYLANLRGEKVSGDVRRLSMMGDIQAIGKSTGRALRSIRAEETDPGARTSAIVDLYKGEGELLGEASQRANILQAQESARISERQSTAEMYQARVKDEITRANQIAEEEWKSRMLAGGVGLAASGVAMFGEQALQQKALLEGQQQDISFIEKLGMKPEEITPEIISSMLEKGEITADQAKILITRKPEKIKPKTFKAPDIIKESLPGGKIQEYEIDPKTGKRIKFGEPYFRRAPTKPTVNNLAEWQKYATELGVPKTILDKAKTYRNVKDLTDKMDTLQGLKRNLADVNTALTQGAGLEEVERFTSEFAVGKTKLPYGSLETEKLNLLREIADLEVELELRESVPSLESIFGD